VLYEEIIYNNDKILKCQLMSLTRSIIWETALAASTDWVHFQAVPFHNWVTLSKVILLLCASISPFVKWRTVIFTFPVKQFDIYR